MPLKLENESLKLASLKYICEAGTWFRHRS